MSFRGPRATATAPGDGSESSRLAQEQLAAQDDYLDAQLENLEQMARMGTHVYVRLWF